MSQIEQGRGGSHALTWRHFLLSMSWRRYFCTFCTKLIFPSHISPLKKEWLLFGIGIANIDESRLPKSHKRNTPLPSSNKLDHNLAQRTERWWYQYNFHGVGWPGFAAPIQVPISDALGRAARPRSPLQTVMDLIHFNGGLQCSLPFCSVTVANWRWLPTYLPEWWRRSASEGGDSWLLQGLCWHSTPAFFHFF